MNTERIVVASSLHRFAVASLLLVGLVTAGCATNRPPVVEQNQPQWLASGVVALARPVPQHEFLSPSKLLGFMPLQAVQLGTWMKVSTTAGAIELMEGNTALLKTAAHGIKSLEPGVYNIVHKQREPLWYAPDRYFVARKLSTPPAGDKRRYLRGALGEYVVYLDKDTPIHSGPVWINDIGGLQLPTKDLARLYYQLEVGSLVRVE